MPFKEEICKNLEGKSAINTIHKFNKDIKYYNTDKLAIEYFMRNLPTYILGTGGAAISAMEALFEYNIKFVIIGRDKKKLKLLSNKYQMKTLLFDEYKNLIKNIEENIQVINCLPPEVSLEPLVTSKSFIIDMTYGIHNYNKVNNYINGYAILYVQAAFQFLYWFGGNIDDIISVYKYGIEKYLSIKYN